MARLCCASTNEQSYEGAVLGEGNATLGEGGMLEPGGAGGEDDLNTLLKRFV